MWHGLKNFSSSLPVRRARLLGTSAILLIGLGACSITPQPVALNEQIAQAAADREAMFNGQEALNGPVTLEQALARAIKYNLQHRLTMMEKALEDRLLDVSAHDLLPKLTARAGLRTRSNELLTVSESRRTGSRSIDPSLSQDRNGGNADLQLSWNVLDFGLSYYAAQSQANRLLASEERRRKVVLSITEQVRAAYWEAVSAQQLKDEVATALTDTRKALDYARQTEQQRLLPPLESLRFQKALLEIIQQLEALDSELASTQATLASLMNLPPATSFRVATPDTNALATPKMPLSVDDLEAIAMIERPEVREEAYLARNTALETRSALLRLLPGANLYGGLNYDSNSYLVNQNWADAGVQVTWNLFNLLNWSDIRDAGEARKQVAEVRRTALRMAVLTQVNLSYHRFERARGLFDRAGELENVERRILGNVNAATQNDAQNVLELVRARASALLASRARGRAYAELQNSLGAIYASAGLDPLPREVSADNVDALAAGIVAVSKDLEAGKVTVPRIAPATTDAASPQATDASTPPAEKVAEGPAGTLDRIEPPVVTQGPIQMAAAGSAAP